MNEELKIIITAITDAAQKGIKEVSGEVERLSASGKNSSKSFGKSMAAIGKVVAGVAVAVVAAIGAIIASVISLGKKSLELGTQMGKLTTAFQASGAGADQASKSYQQFYRFLGDTDKAVEAASHLAKITTNEKELAEWSKVCQGVFATFGDSLPIEGLTEAANETIRVGKVTGVMADALNWAGVSEDAFNAQLATCNSLEEREILTRTTLNDLYKDASDLYEKNNKAILDYNSSQAKLDTTLASFKNSCVPLLTALNNLSSAFLEALAPAINAVAPVLTFFIEKVAEAVKWVSALFSALTGKGAQDVSGSFESASGAVGGYTGSIENATEAAEELKRATMGFDELNVVSSQSSSSSASGSGGGTGADVGTSFDNTAFSESLEKGSKSAEKFASKVKTAFSKLQTKASEYATLFEPTVEAWKTGWNNLDIDWGTVNGNISNGVGSLNTAFSNLGGYVANEFVPNLTNNFSENVAPIMSDVVPWAASEMSEQFEHSCGTIQQVTDDVLIPTMKQVETVTTDVTDAVGKDWEESGTDILSGLTGFFASIRSLWDQFYNNVFSPIWERLTSTFSKLWDEHLKPLWENIVDFGSSVADCILTLWNNVLKPIISWVIDILAPAVVNAINSIIDIVVVIFGIISDVVGGIIKACAGLLDFITGVFSGNWEKAWNGICKFFGGIWDAIWGIVKGVINLIIWALNSLWRAIYSVVSGIVNGIGGIASAIGGLLGQDWGWSMPQEPPLIPYLAKGGVVVGETLAKIGEGGKKEVVLPLEQNTDWMDTLAERISSKNNTPSKIVLMLDKKQLGEATISSINEITRSSGRLQLTVM